MITVSFTPNLLKHLEVPDLQVEGSSLREVLDASFQLNPSARHYILDDQGRVRKHIAIFIDGVIIEDKVTLSDEVKADSAVFVMQALSGG